MSGRRVKEVDEVLREEVIVPVVHEAFRVCAFCVAPLLVLAEF